MCREKEEICPFEEIFSRTIQVPCFKRLLQIYTIINQMMIRKQQQPKYRQNWNQNNICNHLNNVYSLEQTFNNIPISPKSQNSPIKDENEGTLFQANNRPHKKEFQRYVSSFQKDIIKQHLSVAENILPLLFTISVPGYQLNLFSKLEDLQLSKIDDQTIISLIKEEIIKLWKDERKKNTKNPEMPISLIVFLGKIIKRVEKSKLRNTIALTFEIWNEYIKTEDGGQDETKLLINSVTISERIAHKWQQSFDDSEAFAVTLDALNRYCATVLLVANQYFQNPYYEDPSARPAVQDSSESDRSPDKTKPLNMARPHKKIHQNWPESQEM